MRDIIALACTECKRRNYSTTKNKKKTSERLEFSKYCRFCRKHTGHRKKRREPRERSEPATRRASERVGGSGGAKPPGGYVRRGEAPRRILGQ
jgi:large subunit ribosomal protein L33